MTITGQWCENRLFEWISTGMMLGISFILFAWPDTISFSAFHYLVAGGVPQNSVALAFFVFGFVRVVALIANGLVPYYGPLARATCALAGAFLWAQLMFALIDWSHQMARVSPGVPVYLFLAVGEIASCYRAARDGRRSR